jgi:hypothetical protein
MDGIGPCLVEQRVEARICNRTVFASEGSATLRVHIVHTHKLAAHAHLLERACVEPGYVARADDPDTYGLLR